MGGTARRRPQSRSRSTRRRFGFLNLFGFNTDAYDISDQDRGTSTSTTSSRSSSRSHSSAGTASDDGRERDRASSTTTQPQDTGTDNRSGDAIADAVQSSSAAATAPVVPAVSHHPANAELQTSNSQPQLGISGTHPHPDFNDVAGADFEGTQAGDSVSVSPEHPGGLPIVSACKNEHSTSGSLIRTCPIPERLQIQLREQESVDQGSLSMTPWSASTTADSPRMQPEARARR
ncbi:hypothetical protein H4S08_004803, partial [Coemansia sp. RSA 1365]